MTKLYIIIIGILVLTNTASLYKIRSNSLTYSKEINLLKSSINRSLFNNEKENIFVQKNDINTVTTTFKNSGEKIVTEVIDKSIYKKINKNKISAVAEKIEKNEKGKKEDKEVGTKEGNRDPVLTQYKIGLNNFQPNNVNKLSDLTGIFGVRLFSTPIFITTTFPLNYEFYKNYRLGIEFEFNL